METRSINAFTINVPPMIQAVVVQTVVKVLIVLDKAVFAKSDTLYVCLINFFSNKSLGNYVQLKGSTAKRSSYKIKKNEIPLLFIFLFCLRYDVFFVY